MGTLVTTPSVVGLWQIQHPSAPSTFPLQGFRCVPLCPTEQGAISAASTTLSFCLIISSLKVK